MITLIANEVSLAQLRDRFGVVRSTDPDFFRAKLASVPEITSAEQTALDRVQQNYLSQLEVQSLNEETVKMVVVSPLLDQAGFYRFPFTIDSEVSIEIQETDDNGMALIGRIDTLIVRNQLWILVVESKRSRFSVQAAIPQALSYLLARPQPEQPGYALMTNGGEFLFVKLLQQEAPTYGFSATYSLLNPGNDLYKVLAILKQITA
ncbi:MULTISPECIES: restriction endonuclease subunit R [Leptolyngbya]|uniref:Restriction endonuclease subunit R n=1 Tax=Leptolyngbya boryana CZ1 TaxID=3060204 RepID=A0AA96WQ29_LEPBY|nr:MULTISPECIES: restriction endonuclease subunit R [Leptolyngbya]MBN8564751.1 restriction endonuclease subunit R [Leptolyngbya sp. UWPOB_LEPTO1]MCY6490696.1 restriction endonuclease subunit R [Leptolyngbya sp. GGD]WNZ43528.1 restriction endonuclease subunit R [Leptolyngbya boryana CZ1]